MTLDIEPMTNMSMVPPKISMVANPVSGPSKEDGCHQQECLER